MKNQGTRRLLEGVFGGSSFLSDAIISHPAAFASVLESGAADFVQNLINEIKDLPSAPDLPARLRRMRTQAAMAIGWGHLEAEWSIAEEVQHLTLFADAALSRLTAHILEDAHRSGQLAREVQPDDSGFVVLALGKLGAAELNFSSDIDLILLYDPRKLPVSDPDRAQRVAIRLARALVAALETRTADGYIARTDMRLRPDPSSTPLCLSIDAAVSYYETTGQNWERAAFIRARPVAGDIGLGQQFLEDIRPFIWRRHLDFETVRDVQAIKRQIDGAREPDLILPERDLKRGRGGIREIELFAQTLQLIWGGRDATLRSRYTTDALRSLAVAGHIAPEVAEDLSRAYWYLRWAEHRLQLVADQQTHSLPPEDRLDEFARFLGLQDAEALEAELHPVLSTVMTHWNSLYPERPSLGGRGSLVFTGADPDPETVKTLTNMGFIRPADAVAMVQNWHRGRMPATRSRRSRQLLTDLMPTLMEAVAGTPEPDATLARFDALLQKLPAGIQLFSMIQSQPAILELLAEVTGLAPRLADTLIRLPAVLDIMVAPRQDAADVAAADTLIQDLRLMLHESVDQEMQLEGLRSWVEEQRFRLGVGLMTGQLSARKAGPGFTAVADATITRLMPIVEDGFVSQYGRIDAGAFAVLGYGKLGSRELTYGSDLDLVFVWDAPEKAESQAGSRSLAAPPYYARLAQRFNTALRSQGARGRLYETDLRLRPWGNDGPVAVTLQTWRDYLSGEAWTWELMSLTRARIVTAAEPLRGRLERYIFEILSQRRDRDRLARDVLDMRRRTAQSKPGSPPWDIGPMPGGLVDIEFMTQFLVLNHAVDHPQLIGAGTAGVLRCAMQENLLPKDDCKTLVAGLDLWHDLLQMERLVDPRHLRADAPSPAIRTLMSRILNLDEGEDIVRRITDQADAVRDVVNRHLRFWTK